MFGRINVRNWIRVAGIEQTVMHHFEGNAGFDQRLVKAERVIFDFRLSPASPP